MDGGIGGHLWWMGGWGDIGSGWVDKGTFMVDGWMGDIYGGWVDKGTFMVDGWMGDIYGGWVDGGYW